MQLAEDRPWQTSAGHKTFCYEMAWKQIQNTPAELAVCTSTASNPHTLYSPNTVWIWITGPITFKETQWGLYYFLYFSTLFSEDYSISFARSWTASLATISNPAKSSETKNIRKRGVFSAEVQFFENVQFAASLSPSFCTLVIDVSASWTGQVFVSPYHTASHLHFAPSVWASYRTLNGCRIWRNHH